MNPAFHVSLADFTTSVQKLGLEGIVAKRSDSIYIPGKRVIAGFVPHTRAEVFEAIKGLKTSKCPFTNLPERRKVVMHSQKKRCGNVSGSNRNADAKWGSLNEPKAEGCDTRSSEH